MEQAVVICFNVIYQSMSEVLESYEKASMKPAELRIEHET